MSKTFKEGVTLTIPTQLVQKHAENTLSGNGISITNINILAKRVPPTISLFHTYRLFHLRVPGQVDCTSSVP